MRSSVVGRSAAAPRGAPRRRAARPPATRRSRAWSSTAVSASAAPASEARSVAVSSASKTRSAPASSSTWPWPRSRSIGNGSSERDASTRWRRGGACRQSDSITCTAPARARDRLDVVDDEHEVAPERGLERLAERRSEPARARGLVLLRARAGGGRDRPGRVHRQRRDAQPQRVGEPPCEACERRVVGGGRVPGAVDLARPVGEQRRLAEPGSGDDGRQPTLERAARSARSRSRRSSGAGATGGRSRVVEVEGVRERAACTVALLRPMVCSICGPHTIDRVAGASYPDRASLRGPDGEPGREDARVREDARDVLVVPRLLVVGELEPEPVTAGREAVRRDACDRAAKPHRDPAAVERRLERGRVDARSGVGDPNRDGPARADRAGREARARGGPVVDPEPEPEGARVARPGLSKTTW